MNTQHRTQVYLDDFRYRELKKKAVQEGKSFAQAVREAIDVVLRQKEKIDREEKEKAWKEFFKLAGIGRSGLGDLAENHDKYFDAFYLKKKASRSK